MQYSLEDLQDQFDAAALDDASYFLEDGRVALPDIRQDGRLITSLIESPGQRPLRVYIRIQADPGQPPAIHGECSCSRRGNCEHVAAVLLRALSGEGGLQGEGLDRALQGSDLASATGNEYPADVQQRLLYLLSAQTGLSSGIKLHTASGRQLKTGGFGRLSDYQPEWASRGRPPRFLLNQDRRLLLELEGLPGGGPNTARRLQGHRGAELLRQILQTGRGYLGQGELCLHLDAPRPCRFDWELDEQGRQYPRFAAEPPVQAIFMLDAPWYLDLDSGGCGPLQTDLPGPLLNALWELGAGVEAEAIDEVRARLSALAPNAGLPALRSLELETLPPGRPRPCLYFLSETHDTPWGEESLDGVELSFAYHDRRCAGGASQWLEGDRVIRVRRDDAAEAAAAERLFAAGLQQDDPWEDEYAGNFYFPDGQAEDWFELQLYLLPRLRRQGWRIEFDRGFRHRLYAVEEWYGSLTAQQENDWFQLRLGVLLDGQRINLLPALVATLREFPREFRRERLQQLDPEQPMILSLEDERLVSLPLGKVRGILETLFEIYQSGALDESDALPLSRIQLARLLELGEGEDGVPIDGQNEVLVDLARQLRGIEQLPAVTPPKGLQAQLRGYQLEGLSWLQFLRENRLAGVLADDMGLGKTVQTLAHLLLEREQGRMDLPSLVVAPTSLMVNWRREARQFAPDLRVLLLQGPRRHASFKAIPGHDLVLTSYPLLARDRERLLAHEFHLLILDEAQIIKNPKTQASRVARELNARHRLCLTGTPMENHLGELWALFDFLLPGLLGNDRQFRRSLRNPIEKHGDEGAAERLARRLRPFMLRRTKQQVVRELPPKTEILRSVGLEGAQRQLYESIRLAMHRQVREAVAEKGWARSQITVLDALLKLRQVCCDPRLLKLETARQVKGSAKLELLMELLPEMIEEGRRVLLFSQFTSMLSLIEDAVKQAGIEYVKLTGRTRDRAGPVDRFQNGEAPLFLISLKAGGTGLNLTAADTVIHYDPWWNPAVERQATDRAHRIGQENPVFVYKLISEGTVEEKIQAMQAHKQALADSLFEQRGSGPGWREGDLEMLFEPLS